MLPRTDRMETTIKLPRSASTRGSITWIKLLHRVERSSRFGSWNFDGPVVRPGSTVDGSELPRGGLAVECVGSDPGGYGHQRAPYRYRLWRYHAGAWDLVAEAASVGRDWTEDLGPIAAAALEPPRPHLVDPRGVAERIGAEIERETCALDERAKRLVILAVYDRVAALAVG